jgi:hypothetical protein
MGLLRAGQPAISFFMVLQRLKASAPVVREVAGSRCPHGSVWVRVTGA